MIKTWLCQPLNESGVRLPLDLFPRLNSIRGAVKEETTEQRKAAAVRFIVQVCTVQCPPNRAPQAPSCNAATGHHRAQATTGHRAQQSTGNLEASALSSCSLLFQHRQPPCSSSQAGGRSSSSNTHGSCQVPSANQGQQATQLPVCSQHALKA